MNKQKIPNHPLQSVQIFMTALILLFGVFSVSVFAQSWKEPSTLNPSVDPNASSVPNLIRVKTSDDAQYQNKQAVEGKLRIGSASNTNLFSSLEVYGDLAIQNSVLIDDSFGNPKCTTVECTNGTQYPAFLAQDTAGSVGIGTNVLNAGRLHVRAQENEYPDGAVYATSSGGYGVWAHANTTNQAGIRTYAAGPYSIAVFGKAIDVQHRGIYADKGTGVIAALFQGNVDVVGGFYQGDGSQVIRVGNVADIGLPQSGEIGTSTWVKRGVNIAAGSVVEPATTTVNFNFPTGEGYIIKYTSVMLNNGTTFTPLYGVAGVTAVVSNSALVITNTAGIPYNNSIIYAQVQSGVATAVFEYASNPPQGTEIVLAKPILFAANGSYELGATVSGAVSPSFYWKIDSGDGSICPSTNDCGGGKELTTSDHVFYKMPNSLPANPDDRAVIISVTWQGQGGVSISKTITLQLVDLVYPLAVSDRTVEKDGTKEIPVTVSSAPGLPTNLSFQIKTGSGSVSTTQPSTAVFQAVQALFTPKNTIIAKLDIDPTVKKEFDVFVVPKMTIATTFPDGPQLNQATDTVASDKNLHVAVTTSPISATSTIACAVCIQPWTGTEGTYKMGALGAKTISIVWTPDAAAYPDYPQPFSYTKAKVITVGRLYGNATSTVGSTAYVNFWTGGYPSQFLENPIANTSGNTSTFSDPAKSSVIGGDISPTRILTLTEIQNMTATNSTRVTYNVTPNTTPTTVHVKGRSRFDMRDVVDITMTVPTAACVCLGGSQPSCCEGNIANVNIPFNPN